MTHLSMKPIAAATVATAVFASHPSAQAAVTTAPYAPCKSTEGLGDFAALVTYSYSSGTTASLVIELSNTTPLALGGYITAIAVNPGPGVTSMAFIGSSSASFSGLAGPVSALPFGPYMIGASTSGSWLGGGSPAGGIAVGATESFTFSMTGSAAALAALDAETVLAAGCGAMAVRFRGGAVTDWSDKVAGTALPTPGTLALAGLAALGRRRRRRA